MYTETGTFLKWQTTVNDVDTIRLHNTLATPSVIILRATLNAGNGAENINTTAAWGISDGTDEICLGGASDDAAPTTNCGDTIQAEALSLVLPGFASLFGNITRKVAGEFDITWSVNVSLTRPCEYR